MFRNLPDMKTSIPPVLITFALACFALSTGAQAVSPAPDGCYPAFTTAEGCNALAFLTTGIGNTGVGWYSLFSIGSNSFNTELALERWPLTMQIPILHLALERCC